MAEQERTEQATDRQIERFREQGRVATSRELAAALALTSGVLALSAGLPYLRDAVIEVRDTLGMSLPDGELTIVEAVHLLTMACWHVAPVVVAILSVPLAVSALAGMLMTGFNVATDALAPDPARLDPIGAFQQQFLSMTPWVFLAKGLLIALALAWAVWAGIAAHVQAIPTLARLGLDAQLQFAGVVTASVLWRAVPAALAIGAADYLYQRWKMGEDMRMSRQDVKQEHKEHDGDPQIKARRKQRARQLALGSSVRNVRNADAVIVNPTHYAVAVRYRKDESAAPVVVARGVDEVALRIRAEAVRNDVLVVENRPLARALYAATRAGMPIPREFYAPVAQVLAVVYRRRRGAPLTSR